MDYIGKNEDKTSATTLGGGGGEVEPSTVILNFAAVKAGSYTGKVIVYSAENVHDVRVLELKIQATVPTGDLILYFRGPARQDMVQV